MYSNIYLRYLQIITSYINDKIKFSCEQYMYQYCLLATFGLCVDGLYGGGMEWGIIVYTTYHARTLLTVPYVY